MIVNAINTELFYPDIDGELNEILTELKDEYEFKLTTEFDSNNEIMYYTIDMSMTDADDGEATEVDIIEHDDIMLKACYNIPKMMTFLTIVRRISLKVNELGWTCRLPIANIDDDVIIMIYKSTN
jgi:hypothetical protein